MTGPEQAFRPEDHGPRDGQLGWSHAAEGECAYCGARALVFPEPFGDQDACRPCWNLICFGEGED